MIDWRRIHRREPWANPGPLDALRIGPAAGGAARRLVVMLHGRGVTADDLRHAVRHLAGALPHAAFALPHAPNRAAGTKGGREWFTDPARARLLGRPDRAAERAHRRAAGIRAAAPAVDAFLDGELARLALADDSLALFGFSQGCRLALHVGLRRPRGVAAILGYCGGLDAPDRLAQEIAARPPVLLVHGAWDPVVPLAAQDEAATALRAAGCDVTTLVRPYLEHTLDAEGLAAGAALLRRVWAT